MQPLAGRRIWFVGIGGAGLSSYAFLARAWGAEVGGWDRNSTPYLRLLDGATIDIGGEPSAPAGWEVVVSSAYTGQIEGRTRAELLAELVSLTPSIVIAGAHGKTTTTAMVAFVLREVGNDPSWLVGGEIPQLGGNAGAGSGWLVVEGDESDRTVEALRPAIGVVTNVELDHHATFGSEAEVGALFEAWLAEVPRPIRGWELDPVDATELPLLRGAHNRLNAAAALAALELAGIPRADALPALAGFRGVGRRLEWKGEFGEIAVYDDYGHHPTEVAATIAAAREGLDGRLLVAFQPHLYSRTRHLARQFGTALAAADAVCVTEIYGAREQPVDGVSGKLVVDAVADAGHGRQLAWTPVLEDAAKVLRHWARPGDAIVTMGAGDVDRVAALLLERG